MCCISVIIGYLQERRAPTEWTPSGFTTFRMLLDHAEKVDKELGEPDCIDPEKEKYIASIEAELKKARERLNDVDIKRVG